MAVPVFKPSIKRRDMHSVLSCLVTDIIGPGMIADDLTAALAAQLNCEGGRALREYGRALELTVDALELKSGDRVLISPLAPPPYRRVFTARGLLPVFADVQESDACLLPESVSKIPDDDIKAVFIHAPLGCIPSLPHLSENSVPVVEDLSQSLGKERLNPPGRYTIVSMEADGIVTCGGGTLVLAQDQPALSALAAAAEPLGADAFLPDLNASLGLVQLREHERALEDRNTIAQIYKQSLSRGRHRTFSDPEKNGVPYSFPVVLDGGLSEVEKYARKKGVETLPAFFGGMMDGYPAAGESCPAARKLMLSTLLFPLYPTLGKSNVQLISKVLSTLP